MRPRLRADVRYARSPDGVYVHGVAGACTLPGDASYERLDRLAPFLTGEHMLDDLVAPLPPDQQAAVEQMVATLVDQRLLVDGRDDERHDLDAQERRVYAPEIEFIRYAADSAEYRFERLRAARVALLGAGPVLAALLRAGLRSGWRRVLVRTDEVDDLDEVAREAIRDGAQDVRVAAAGEPPGEADLVLCVSDRLGELVAAAQSCARSGTALGQVLVGGGEAWMTAVGPPQRVMAESCWHRLGAWQAPETGDGLLTGPVPDVVAAHLALSCFSFLTGLAGEIDAPVLTRVDLRDLTTRTHRPRPWVVTTRQGLRLDHVVAAGFHEPLRPIVDERVGVLRRLDEDDLPQVPLAVCRATVSDPRAVLPAGAPAPVVTGWGADRDEARARAALAGLATYASLVDRASERVDLLTNRVRVVPPVDARVPYRAPVGVAAGRSWSDAVAAGLRAHCEALLAEYVDEVRHADLAPMVRDDQATGLLLHVLLAADVDLEWADLGRVLGVPAFAFRAGGVSTTTCAATAVEALRDGLARLVVHWQCGVPVDVPTRWAVELEEPRPGAPAADPRCRALVSALHRAGRTPFALPLMVDDDVHPLAPCLVRVVVDGG